MCGPPPDFDTVTLYIDRKTGDTWSEAGGEYFHAEWHHVETPHSLHHDAEPVPPTLAVVANIDMAQVMDMRGLCATCLYAAGFTIGPSPSGPQDGVNCTCKAKWSELGQDEFNVAGYVNVFRTEVLDSDLRCEQWYPSWDYITEHPEHTPTCCLEMQHLRDAGQVFQELSLAGPTWMMAAQDKNGGLGSIVLAHCPKCGKRVGEWR